MPLDTDCFIARSLCARAAELGESEGVEPPRRADPERDAVLVPHAVPGQHPALDDDVLLRSSGEVCDSLAHHGFEHLVAVNGHGGNAAALTVAVNHYLETTGRRVFLAQWWDLAATCSPRSRGR